MGQAPAATDTASHPLPDWKQIHSELQRPNVTLLLLWQEYQKTHADRAYSYSRFCELYQNWAGTVEPVLRQVHIPGEKLFVDWAGQTIPLRNRDDGSITQASIFVAALGVSSKTFVEAFSDQKLASWIAAHCHAYAFYGGVPSITIPDNPKTAVLRVSRYEPVLHPTYQEMATHYQTAIVPARAGKPRDKAKVETAVQIVQRQILAPLRDQTFFSVGELNQVILSRLAELNARPYQKLDGCRNSWFETLDKPKLLPLPVTPYELAQWSEVTVNIDYHVVIDKHLYSVPNGLIHQTLDARVTDKIVELFHQGKRVAVHPRSFLPGKFTTMEEHRPKSHQRHLEWTPGRLVEWAEKVGPSCAQVVAHVLQSKPHPEQGFRSVLGIMRMGKGGEEARLEAACRRALHFGTCSYGSIKSILDRKLDTQPLEPELPFQTPAHRNIRGQGYFN